ncbi:methyltransferase domain-containing protein [Lamprocystis purpurea]|jgi:hypothetical protein|uniref:methyltransferase domain-containing protein n=1 Tax=Lamprocystis purpurea TaxID=61598 RepID=UPI00036082DA|nr:methyltransferase domain-containing protein [Lamprocystis purpurea]
MNERNQQLLAGLTKADRIIEIGPLHAPIAPKAAGWTTTVVDHAPRDELIAKYALDKSIDPDLIQDVDVIWRGGSLCDAFPTGAQGGYKALIASHVIEHVPDFIGFLNSAAMLLQPSDCILALAVPDKRWCFDLFKPISTTGQILAAHRARLARHSPDKLFDHNAYSASDRGRTCWGREKLSDLHFYVRLENAKVAFDAWRDESDAPYVDCHAWQFTPSSFELLILELGEIGAVDWQIDWVVPQPTTEFTVHLRRGRRQFASSGEVEAQRIHLLKGIAAELREQANWLLDDSAVQNLDSPIILEGSARLDRLEASLAAGEARSAGLETSLVALQEGLRPVQSLLAALLPMRRMIARLRGRI